MADDPLASFHPVLEQITAAERTLRRLSDPELQARARQIQLAVRAGTPVDDLLVDSFALSRDACRRALDMHPFEVQLAAGIALHRGRLVEMATGEGKTLAAVAPVFLNALTGRGVHVLTFNDYLARRDAAWMGPAYRLLGLEVDCVQEGMTTSRRQQAYRADITYLTAKEAGFDLLRDGLCMKPEDQVHRALHLALVDEADSILIDEARIPLVIAGAVIEEGLPLPRLAEVASTLRRDEHFDTDEMSRNIFLTEAGTLRVEQLLGCGSLFAPENLNLLAAVRNALHAEVLLRRDVDYIVRQRRIALVDQQTGRVATGRHWPDGLHAAVEAKEGLQPIHGGRVLGSITLQQFLRRYPRLCGMTATARAARDEFSEFYDLEVVPIPSHRPCVRLDRPDRIYPSNRARDEAVVEEIARVHTTGRPVLVGTASVAASEQLAAALRRRGVECQVLNAKNDEAEAMIVAEAGARGAVTISTNMAGRGTDIRLGGKLERDRGQVRELGGLYVLGTHRHESRRIDDQLRGRAGRQGDPGTSRFFVSLEDDLLQQYGISALIPHRLVPRQGSDPIDSKVVRREVARAQRIIEGSGLDIRRRLTAYSAVIEHQHQRLAGWRQEVLEGHGELELLATRAPDRWKRLAEQTGFAALNAVERRLTLLAIDECWSEYLQEMQHVRDEIHLVALGGRTPLAEFNRTAIAAFEPLLERIDSVIVDAFRALSIGPEGADWAQTALRRPSATWTYLVTDNDFADNTLLTLANRPTIGLWATILLWPVLFVWGIYLHWKKRRRPERYNRNSPISGEP